MKSFLKFNLNVSKLTYDRSYSLFIYVIGAWRSLYINLSFHDDDDGDDDDGEKYIYNLEQAYLAR